VIFRRSATLADRCADVESAIRDRNGRRVTRSVARLWEAAQQASRPELDQALPRCAALLPELGVGAGGRFAVLCGALVELGARPDPLVPPVATGLADALTRAVRFRAGWRRVRPGVRPPASTGPAGVADATAAMVELHGPGEEADLTALAWFAAEQWALPATTLLQLSAGVRATFRARPGLVPAAEELVGELSDLDCLVGLLRLLEREQLLVLHRATGRGWWVTVDGVGDNYQLHTLLAGALSGPAERGLIEGLTVEPAWLAVATDAPRDRFSGAVVGNFNLVDGHGRWIRHEDVPADIPLFQGARVVVLDPPPYRRGWTNVRRFPALAGSVTVDAPLPVPDAKAWLARVAPGVDAI
jgi:hypothetical protein